MAKAPQKLKPNKERINTTIKAKPHVYNALVRIREEGESLSDVIERLLAHKNCTFIKQGG